MKAIRGMQRGVKQEPKGTNSERVAKLEIELQNMQMAGRVTQMLVQQVVQNMQNMGQDLGKAYGIINELQYKVLAMQNLGSFDKEALAKKVEELRLNDFVEASDAEDKRDGLSLGDIVLPESTVIITSTVSDNSEAGIFRSRIKLADCGVPSLIEGLTGKQVGEKVACQINGQEHTVELLGIRNPPPPAPVEQVQ